MRKYKIAVTVPVDEADLLRAAIGKAGGGKMGNYTHCSFSIKGTGRFLPTEGADPTIGKVGKLEQVAEEKVEINCDEESLKMIVEVIRKNHSYEEPMIDVYELLDV